MQIKRKIVQQILLSKRELQVVFDLARKAEQGQTVHYAEEQIGSIHFGVGIDDKYDSQVKADRLYQDGVNAKLK